MSKVDQNNSSHTFPDNYMDHVRESIQNYFESQYLKKAGHCFLDFITETPPSEYPDLSFGSARQVLRRKTDLNLSDGDCLEVLSYFTSGLSRLLDVILTYVDEDSGLPYRLSNEEARRVLRYGKYYHPIEHDELVEDINSHLLISYKPSKLGKQLYDYHHIKA